SSRQLLCGDFPEDALDSYHVPFEVVYRGLEHLDENRLAVGSGVSFHILENLAGFHDFSVVLPILSSQLVREEIEIGAAEDLFERPAQLFAEQAIRVDKSPLAILAEDVERQRFDQGLVQRLRVAQGLFGLFAGK